MQLTFPYSGDTIENGRLNYYEPDGIKLANLVFIIVKDGHQQIILAVIPELLGEKVHIDVKGRYYEGEGPDAQGYREVAPVRVVLYAYGVDLVFDHCENVRQSHHEDWGEDAGIPLLFKYKIILGLVVKHY